MSNTIEDVDDDLFISKKPQNYIFAEKKAQDLNEKTTKRLLNARSLVEESERVGQSALENLSSQRETLERVDNDLDNINSITRSTQKHLNNMKSFFGGFKSLFSSKQEANPAALVPTTKQGIPRSATIATMPSTTNRSSSQSPQTSSSAVAAKASLGSSSSSSNNNNKSQNVSMSQQYTSTSTKLDNPEDEFQANLSELGFGLGRLKEMAMQLGDEIGDQNEMLDRITEKSERASDSMNHQNRQLQQLLKKG